MFVAAVAVILARGFSDITLLNDRLDKWIYLAEVFGLIGAVGTLLVIYDAIRSWFSTRRIWSKLYSTLLALACAGFLWFVFAGNLLRFTSRY